MTLDATNTFDKEGTMSSMEGTSGFYREALRGRKPLTHEEEVAIGRRITEEKSIEARNILVERYLPFVLHMAAVLRKKYPHHYEDIVQAGTEGLIDAAGRWDYTRGYRFSVYAKWYIVSHVNTYLKNTFGMKISPILFQKDSRVLRASHTLEARLGRRPRASEIAEELGIDELEVVPSLLRSKATRLQSLAEPVNDSEGAAEFGDSIPDTMSFPPNLLPEIEDELKAARARLSRLFESLENTPKMTDRKREIFKAFYGLGPPGTRRKTLEEIAFELSVSRERIRQVILWVLKALGDTGLSTKVNPFRSEFERIALLEEILSAAREQ